LGIFFGFVFSVSFLFFLFFPVMIFWVFRNNYKSKTTLKKWNLSKNWSMKNSKFEQIWNLDKLKNCTKSYFVQIWTKSKFEQNINLNKIQNLNKF
jgi:hypothetical protein